MENNLAIEAPIANRATLTIGAPTIGTNVEVVARFGERPTTVAGGLDEQAVRDEFHRLWAKHDADLATNAEENDNLAMTQQSRLREFLVEAYPQALELIKPQHRELLNKLIRDVMKATPQTTDSGLFVQIAALQIGSNNKKSEFKVPARRNERYGLLFRIFAEKGWIPENLDSEIKLAGGTSKVIEDHKLAREKASGIVKKREDASARAYDNAFSVPSVTMPGCSPKASGKWRLALVSIHDEGEVRVHKLIGKSDDASTKRALGAYADEQVANV